MPPPHHWNGCCRVAGTQWGWLLVLLRIRQSSAKQKTLSRCQPCNAGIWGNTCVVIHGTVGLTSTCHIASLSVLLPSSGKWEPLCSLYKRFHKYVTSYPVKQICFLLCPNLVLLSSFRSKSVPLSHRINKSHQEKCPTQQRRWILHPTLSLGQSTGEHKELVYKGIFTSKRTRISLSRVVQQPRVNTFQSQGANPFH